MCAYGCVGVRLDCVPPWSFDMSYDPMKGTEDNPVLKCPCTRAEMDPPEVKISQTAGRSLCSNLTGLC